MALSDKILDRVGADNLRSGSILASIAKRRGVARTADFRRIESLPRRVWDADKEELEELRFGLSEMLRPKTPPGQQPLFDVPPDELYILKVIQAAALRDIHDHRGAFLPVSVGAGKGFIALLAAVVLEAERPVLFVPADLREQTNRKVIPDLVRHFRLHPRLRVIGNSELSLEKNNAMLDALQPDLIILDECHEYKNKKAGRTRRMARYMAGRPDTIMVAMSGTVSNRSLKDYQHIIRWCLGDRATPMPIKWMELCDWADALDEGVPDQSRMAPGALSRFTRDAENARQGYRRRLTETPGVIASGAEELGVSLRIRKLQPELPAAVSRMIGDLRASWEDPNGDTIAEAVHIWRLARQIALGFWYEWIPPAPRPWLAARKEWKGLVRHTLSHNQRNLDTELQVWNEQSQEHNEPRKPHTPPEPDADALPEAWLAYREKVEQHPARLAQYEQQHAAWMSTINPAHCEWCVWYTIKGTFKPNPVAQWIDFFMIDEVARWLKAGDGIVWVEHTALGERLSQELKAPYFGAGKKASREILDASGAIVASIRAHGQGKNLQQWHRNLVTSPSSSGKTWEQMTGRTHRFGQKADAVTFDVLMSIEEQVNSFTQACADAVYLEDSLGGRQRLNYADIVFEV